MSKDLAVGQQVAVLVEIVGVYPHQSVLSVRLVNAEGPAFLISLADIVTGDHLTASPVSQTTPASD